MSDYADWLKNLKVGDRVIVDDLGPGIGAFDKVAKFTLSQIVTGRGHRFRREDGRRVGKGTIWTRLSLNEPTPERCAAIQHKGLVYALKGIAWDIYDLTTLEAVLALLGKTQ